MIIVQAKIIIIIGLVIKEGKKKITNTLNEAEELDAADLRCAVLGKIHCVMDG
jgi:hypothetical protein